MLDFHEYLKDVFFKLNVRIQKMNTAREKQGLSTLGGAAATLLGPMSLLVQSDACAGLSLAETIQVDAILEMHHSIKLELQSLLDEAGLLLDPDQAPGWVPPDADFVELFSFGGVTVRGLDAESALVSLAVQEAPENQALIRQALASGKFPRLGERIVDNGGALPAT